MNTSLISLIKEKKLLLEKEVFDMLGKFHSPELATLFLTQFERYSGQKMITLALLREHATYFTTFLTQLPPDQRAFVEVAFTQAGFSSSHILEQPVSVRPVNPVPSYRLSYASTKTDKKLEVGDFVSHFRNRYQQLQRILMQRPDLTNLITFNKLGSERQQVSVIGIVSSKRVSKNGNLIVMLEDLTGKLPVVFRLDKPEMAAKAGELQLDDVIAVKGSGSKDILFAYDFYYPDSFLSQKTVFEEDCSIAFISDIHCGSHRHLGKEFERFLDWLNSDDPVALKITYLFIPGDTVDGVGVFPGQEHVLTLKTLSEQYLLLASYLQRVPKRITMFLCPGQHDASRVAEPQPIVHKVYAAPLFALDNLVLVTNPTLVTLLEGTKEFRVLMYHGASIHSFIHEIPELRLQKAHRSPAKAVRHMLKRRHLAPIHGEVTYIPNADKDPLVIGEVPDVLCTGEVHRLDIESYNGTLIITGSCWQAQTPFEEKVGNIPDPCKVPVLNLKTRELRVLDFSGEEHGN